MLETGSMQFPTVTLLTSTNWGWWIPNVRLTAEKDISSQLGISAPCFEIQEGELGELQIVEIAPLAALDPTTTRDFCPFTFATQVTIAKIYFNEVEAGEAAVTFSFPVLEKFTWATKKTLVG